MPLNVFFLSWIFSEVSSFIPIKLNCLALLSLELTTAFPSTRLCFLAQFCKLFVPCPEEFNFLPSRVTSLQCFAFCIKKLWVCIFHCISLQHFKTLMKKNGFRRPRSCLFNLPLESFPKYNAPSLSFFWWFNFFVL